MSSRQMKRLQHLVAASTGADGDVDEEGEESFPSTMKPTASKKAKKGKKHQHPPPQVQGDEQTVEREASLQPGPHTENIMHDASTDSEDEPSTDCGRDRKKKKANKKKKTPSSASPNSPHEPDVAALGKKENKKALQKKKRRQDEAEDEALLAAALERRREAGGDDFTDLLSDPAEPSGGLSTDALLLNLMTRADPSRLDMRLERIRNFGPEAVEDVGDGSVPKHRADGRPSDTGSNSFFPEHGQRLRFRSCAFATPNRYRWPPHDSLGVALKVVGRPDPPVVYSPDPSEPEEVNYAVDTDTAAFRRADEARMLCVLMNAPIQGLLDCLGQHGCYHIPTLLQASHSFEVTGSTAHAQELMDLALYQVGTLLAHIRVDATWQQRQIPGAFATNELIFGVLSRSVHISLRRGCTRTAWEMAKFVLSLDPTDPEGMLLQLDYAALRAKRWVWLLRVHQLAHKRLAEEGADSALAHSLCTLAEGATPTLTQHDVVGTLALDLCRLPGFAFSAALARHFLAREAEREAAVDAQPPYRSKVLRDATAEERQMLADAPPAEQMLATAIATFPEAAQYLLDALQGIDAVCRGAPRSIDSYWSDVLALRRDRFQDSPDHRDIVQTAELFAARHSDMWKAQETLGFLRAALTHEGTEDGMSWLEAAAQRIPAPVTALRDQMVIARATAARAEATRELDGCSIRRYGSVTKDEVLGSAGTAIPADVLAAAQQPAPEFNQEGIERLAEELPHWAGRGAAPLNEVDHDVLLRFRALYGSLDERQFRTENEQLAEYRRRFLQEGAIQRVLGQHNPLELYMRMLMPWNSTEEMGLRELLQERGIEDPIERREQEDRQANERIWAEDEAAAESAEDSEGDWQSLHSEEESEGEESH